PGPDSISRRLDPKEPLGSQRTASPTPKQASATAPARESPRETRAQGPAGQEADGPHRTLQVDSRTQRSGRSPSVSPDRGSTPTSPYSVPQIAPLPSSTLCPICKTSDLTSTPSQPNFNTCTQCHNKVCNQCGFNPNPHLTQVKEWLCLNCQMQRALGMDMTTAPRSKSQQQLHSPALSPAHSPAKQPLGKPEQEPSRVPGGPQLGSRQADTSRATPVPRPAQAAAPPEVGKVSPQPSVPTKPSTAEPRLPTGEAPAKSATTVPSGLSASEQTQEGLTGKLFGLGASLLTQASTLMSVQPEADPQGQPSPSKGPPKIVFSDARKEAGPRPPTSRPGPIPGTKTEPEARMGPGSGPGTLAKTGGITSPKHGKAEHQAVSKTAAKPKTTPKEKASCPLCQAELNMGSKGPANYNTCTTCKLQVCNLCGFNPTPHLVEKTEWLCLNCQTKRLLEGSLGEQTPLPLPTSQQPPIGAPHHAAGSAPLKQKGPQGLGQPSSPLPTKASPLPPKPTPFPNKASPQAKPFKAPESSKIPSSAHEKKTGIPAKAEPIPKPPPETTLPPGTPKVKSGVRRIERASPVVKAVPEASKSGDAEEPVGKPYSQDLSRSPQSLSDTGYSSDGVSSSQSEITGVVQQEVEQLDSAGVTGPRPPSPSELHKVGSGVRPLLEAQPAASSAEQSKPPCSGTGEEQKRRPHSLSIMPEAFDSDEELEDILEEDEDSLEWGHQREQRDTAESSDDFGSQLRHDYVEDSSEGGLSPLPPQPPLRAAELTDEEFMRRQILEMSAEEDNLEEDDTAVSGCGLAKYSTRPRPESSQEPAALPKRRLPHNATTGYEELLSEEGPTESTDSGGALQGGLRRFKTIELNSSGSYSHELDLGQGPDASLDREPELEMESLTGSPEDRSRGEHSSTLPASTPSYTSGTSPTSLSSLEEDSDSSPSRRQRLEEAKQQRKARHRSHGPLLPTIEDSSEEEELREEEELLREQEKMREVEQQRIRSTARKTRRDKEELRAQRRRERSKTPPSNLSPIEDASPTEELRQAAEMEELHRSSCSEYSPSPSLDSEAEALDGGPSRLYKSGSEYNLPTFMSLYSPTEMPSGSSTTPSSGRPLKSAEEAYEEMMRKAELLQRQQSQVVGAHGSPGGPSQPIGPRGQGTFEYRDAPDRDYGRAAQPAPEGTAASLGTAVYEEILQTSQSIARMRQASSQDLAFPEDKKKERQFLNADSAYMDPMKQNGGPLTPGTSPTQLAAPVSFTTSTSSDSSGGRVIPDVHVTQHFAKEPQDSLKLHSSPSSPSSASKEVGTSVSQGPGTPATTAVAPCPASLPRGYIAPTSPAGSERTPSPSSTAYSYGQSPTTANYGSQTDELPEASSGSAAGSWAAREKPLSRTDGEAGPPHASWGYSYLAGSSPPLSPSSPSESPTFSPGKLGPRATAEFSTQTPRPLSSLEMPRSPGTPTCTSMVAQGTQTPHRPSTPCLVWQQTSQEAPFVVITLASDASSQTRMVHASASTSPLCSPTDSQPTTHSYSQTTPPSVSQLSSETPGPPGFPRAPSAGVEGPLALYSWGTLPAENISLCRISSVPGTSRVEPGPRPPGSAVVDLRTAVKPTPVILTDQGMDLTSLAMEARKYGLALDPIPGRQSTAVQPLVINLNAQEQTHAFLGTATTVSITMASSVLMAQQKQPMVYGDPFQSRLDFGQGSGSPVCLAQVKQVEQAVQTAPYKSGSRGRPREAKFARYNLPNQVAPLARRDVLITQMGATQSVSLKSGPVSEPSAEPHRAIPSELRSHAVLGARKPHTVVVQMGEGTAGTVTTLLPEEPASALDLTGMRPESQLACCDMVYKFPFGSSCTGTFHPAPNAPEKSVADTSLPGQSSGPFYSPRDPELSEPPTYQAQRVMGPGLHEEQRPYPQGLPGRLYSSMSDTNLAEAGLNYHAQRLGQLFQGSGRDSAMDLSSLKHSYSLGFADGRYIGQGLQYGSFTDLRHPTDHLTHPLPMRRYSSVSNIYSDHRYGPRGDAVGFQEASLAQYSATTAREISRMCAALNSMDQYGGRHGSGSTGPDLVQYQPQHEPGLSAPQGLAPLRPGLLGNPTFPEGHPGPRNLAQYGPAAGQGTVVRQLLPSTATVRAADGMIYSTINTPIAATLPITTQPASVLRPMVRGGMYRPYVSGVATAVPLTSLTRVPMIAPRVPLGPAGLYRYPAPSRFPISSSVPPSEGPVYLGKPAAKAPGVGGQPRPELQAGAAREEPHSTAAPAAVKESVAAPAPPPGQKPPGDAAAGGGSVALGRPGLEKENASQEERQRKQQEQLLQLERERVELEKLRQLRLQEELERERVELQRHREEEQLLVQRELQELQTIKHHVLQQQQEERQAQFALQREQLAQQRLQLEQIQQLQQQLQQQLEEQKQRQKAPFPAACEAPSRGPPPAAPELAQNGQYWPPLTHTTFLAVAGPEGPGQPREPVLHRGLPSSASDLSLQTEEPWEAGRSGIKKRHSMPRLRDVCEPESAPEPYVIKRIADSSVQTDDEDGEGRYLLTRRRRTRRSTDCSVQTDDEDNAEWEQPVRRRRSRLSRHSDSGSDSKHDATASSSTATTTARAMSSVGIQTISDCSVQTEPDQLPRVSPAIHITAATDPKVEIIRYISAPEKTGHGESLACQTEPDGQAQGMAGPQLVGPTAISPYLPGIQIITPGPLGRFEKKKPDPLEIGYQAHLPPESLSQLVSRQPPKSPQVLYSPVSPLSPHRLLDTSFASSERLNKVHVSPQKHFTTDSMLRQQTLPRPMKTLQRSLSDPKPLSPTAEESAKERFSLYQHQGGLGSQVSALPPNGLARKVKRTLPSPPPEEGHLPLAGQAPPQLYAASLLQRGLVGPTTIPATKASLLRELDRDLRLVEHESTKLRKKQEELDEEEKEIDAKLKYLELGITQRKESLAKDRGDRECSPLRGLGVHRDYLSDSELNQLRLQGCTTPSGQYAGFPATAVAPATPAAPTAFQQSRFLPPAPQYTAGNIGPAQNELPAHQAPTYPGPNTYPAPAFPPSTSYSAEPSLPNQQAFCPSGHYAAQTPMPTTQSTLLPVPADSRAPHQKPRQTSLADLEQKVPTNYEVIPSPVVAMSSAPSESSYSGPAVSSSYEQGKAPELPRASDRGSVSQSPVPTYTSDSHYTSLEQNVPRNYVMIDDISELTKDSTPTVPDSQRLEPLGPGISGRPGKEPGEPGVLEGATLPCCYARGEEESEEDSYDFRGKAGHHHRSMESNGRPASTHYYSDSDYRHGARVEKYGPGPVGPKHPSKSLAPAAISSKRSKHRKQGIEQKISKFSPIEEAKDVESDLASYPSPAVSSSLASRSRKFQDEITYGLKKNVYEQQRYYGVSSRDVTEEDDRMYGGSSWSRVASAYSGEKLSSHDFSGRGKGYEREREAVDRLQKAGPKPSSLSMAHGRARPPMRSQASEEESPVSPLGRPRPAGGTLPPGDTCPQFCSSHSMPDVQEHVKDGPRAHSYKREEGYILDDSHCVVSDSEAYHLGQEETDWFDKPRDARSDRLRHHGGHAVSSSSQKRGPARHSYHDYDEPPEEGLWPHDEGGPGRHGPAKEHRHHSEHGRHAGRHAGEEPGRRTAKSHARDLGRHETRPHPQPSPTPAMLKKGQPGYPGPTDYPQPSRAPAAHHHASDSKKGSRQAHSGPASLQPKPEPQAPPQPQSRQAAPGPPQSQPPPSRQMPSGASLRQPQMQQQPSPPPPQQQQQQPGLGQQPPQQASSQARPQQQSQPTARGPASAAGQPAGKPHPGSTTAPGPQPVGPPRAEQADGSKVTAKTPQQGRVPQAQPTPGPGPAGTKPGARPGGPPGTTPGQPGVDGESVLSKILPGGAAEQAGKLTEAVSAFGKKFSSFW
ncbi:protein bassoon, partial [Fukomys damarensis]|uniref:protein bassoon n=1 Tax=Fukomys damarensis TaxID=885580 RepID=UPI00053FA0DB